MLFLTIYVNLSKIAIGAGVFFLLVFTTGLKWGVPPGGGYGGQGGLLFFVGAFGG
jgi:hypothetical protein